MRSTAGTASVRLYQLGEGEAGDAPRTLLYGTLDEALAMAHAQPAAVQAELYLQTDTDVVAFLDLDGG